MLMANQKYPTPYGKVEVLMIYWKAAPEPEVRRNLELLRDEFQQYNYDITEYAIDYEHGCHYDDLDKCLLNWRTTVRKRDYVTLMIVYYVGHGYVDDVDDGSNTFWCLCGDDDGRSSSEGPKLAWTALQQGLLHVSNGHVLLLFVSCFSGSCLRLNEPSCKVEALCSSSFNKPTSRSPYINFTIPLVEILREHREKKEWVAVSALEALITSRQRRFEGTKRHGLSLVNEMGCATGVGSVEHQFGKLLIELCQTDATFGSKISGLMNGVEDPGQIEKLVRGGFLDHDAVRAAIQEQYSSGGAAQQLDPRHRAMLTKVLDDIKFLKDPKPTAYEAPSYLPFHAGLSIITLRPFVPSPNGAYPPSVADGGISMTNNTQHFFNSRHAQGLFQPVTTTPLFSAVQDSTMAFGPSTNSDPPRQMSGPHQVGQRVTVTDRLDDQDTSDGSKRFHDDHRRGPPGVAAQYWDRIYNRGDSQTRGPETREMREREIRRRDGTTYRRALLILAKDLSMASEPGGTQMVNTKRNNLMATRRCLGREFFDFMDEQGISFSYHGEKWEFVDRQAA